MIDEKDILIIIEALGNRGPFPDTLTKNLAGIPLIKRAIILATELTVSTNILVVTDSEEVELISERAGVKITSSEGLYKILNSFDQEIKVISLSPYCPDKSK